MGTATRMQTFNATRTYTFYFSDCPTCGVAFGIPKELEQRRRNDEKDMYCPNGHIMVFSQRSDKLKEQEKEIRRLKDDRQRYADRERAARAEAERERRSAAATRGHLTRARKRAANGVCPQAGCKRSFESLATHVHDCHPDLVSTLDTQPGDTVKG